MKKLHAFIFLITTVLFTNSCKNSNVDEINSNSKSKSDSVVKTTPDSLSTIETVKIGTQIWTAKNLDVFTYQNGDSIKELKNKADLELNKDTIGAWCYYNFDAKNSKKYGKLYNFAAVKDPRGLAPKGFHIPTVLEYQWYNNPALNEKGFNAIPAGALFIESHEDISRIILNFESYVPKYITTRNFNSLGGQAYFACRDNISVFFECEQCPIIKYYKINNYLSVRCIKD